MEKNNKHIHSVFLLAGFVTIFRMIQILFFTNPATGYYSGSGSVASVLAYSVFYVVLAGSVVYFYKLADTGYHKYNAKNITHNKSILLAAVCFLLAFVAVFYLYMAYNEILYRQTVLFHTSALFKVELAANALSVISFAVLGVKFLTQKPMPVFALFLMSAPIIWLCAVIFNNYASLISILHIVDEQLYVGALFACLMFFMAHARVFVYGDAKSIKSAAFLACVCFMATTTLFMQEVLKHFINHTAFFALHETLFFTAMAVYSFIFAYKISIKE